MDQIIRRLETLHRALRTPENARPENACSDTRLAETVAACLRELHAIAAQAAEDADRPHLRLIDCGVG